LKNYYESVHQPCPDCGSSDALAKYADGNTYCFSCQKRIGGGEVRIMSNSMQIKKSDITPVKVGNETDILNRKITKNTCKTYGVTRGVNALYFPYYDVDRTHIANKVRSTNSV
jgi:twinkle protein